MLRRLALAALVLAAVLLPLLRSGGTSEPSQSERRWTRLLLLRERLNVAGARWGALTERDSAAIPARRTARPGRPDVQLRGFGSSIVAPSVVKLVNDLWSWLGPADSSVRVALAIYNDSEYQFRQRMWWNYSGASISAENGVTTCVTFLAGSRQKDGAIVVSRERLEGGMAPCILLAGFGPPGPAIQRWLDNTRYAAAGSTAWLNRSKSFIDGGRGAMPWMTDWPYGPQWEPSAWTECGRL